MHACSPSAALQVITITGEKMKTSTPQTRFDDVHAILGVLHDSHLIQHFKLMHQCELANGICRLPCGAYHHVCQNEIY